MEDEGLRGPAVFLEEEGEVIEEVSLKGFAGLHSEVAGGFDERGARDVHPDAVGPDTGGQRVTLVGEPVGEFKTSASVLKDFVFFTENREKGTRDFFATGARISTLENDGIDGLGSLLDNHGTRRIVRGVCFERGDRTREGVKLPALRLVDLLVDCFREIKVEKVVGSLVLRHDGFDVIVNGAGKFFTFLEEGFGFFGLAGLGNQGKFLRLHGAIEDSVEGMEIGGGNGVVLVIMATGAGDGKAHDAPGADIDLIGNDEFTPPALITTTDGEESQGGEFFAREVHEVGGNLTMDELIVGKVVIESVDDPVAVGVGVGVFLVFGVGGALGVSVAGDIEPVAGPAFAESLPGEEVVGEMSEPIRTGLF